MEIDGGKLITNFWNWLIAYHCDTTDFLWVHRITCGPYLPTAIILVGVGAVFIWAVIQFLKEYRKNDNKWEW